MKKIFLLSVATLLVGLLSVTKTQAQEAAKEEVATIVKLKEKRSCCSKKDGKKGCKEKEAKKELTNETKACNKKNHGDKKCCQTAAKKEEETVPVVK